jgi:hypothetical protein
MKKRKAGKKDNKKDGTLKKKEEEGKAIPVRGRGGP